MEILWGEVLSLKINPNRIDYFKKSCSIFWQYEEEIIQDGCQLKIRNNSDIVNVSIYNTGSITIRGSPKNSFSEDINEIIERIVKTIEIPFNESDHHLIDRAKTLRDYIKELDTKYDVNRMTIVILSDTACEILLLSRAELIAEKRDIPTKNLKFSNRGSIFDFIEKKDCIEVMEKKVKNLRERRNKLVHNGDIPAKDDAIYAINVLNEYLRM